MSGDAEGQIVLIQAADYLQSRRQVKDFATWSQCFDTQAGKTQQKIQVAIVDHINSSVTKPRTQAIQSGTGWIACHCAKRAGAPCVLPVCVCSLCASLDHVRTTCPFKPPVDYYPSEGNRPPSEYQRPPPDYSRPDYAQSRRPPCPGLNSPACRKWNRYNLSPCGYAHVCSNCRETDHLTRRPQAVNAQCYSHCFAH